MNWDQIESKWAAMTRRVRCDRPADIKNAALQHPQRRRDVPGVTVPPLGQAPNRQTEAGFITETDTLQAE